MAHKLVVEVMKSTWELVVAQFVEAINLTGAGARDVMDHGAGDGVWVGG